MKRRNQLAFEVVKEQKKKLFSIAQRIIPNITEEDLLQPNDYPELEENPEFRYEEGILAGMQILQEAWKQEELSS